MFLLILATIVGAVELFAIPHSEVAQQVAEAFAMHDRVFSIILFLGLLTGGIALIQKHKLNRTQGL